MPAAKKWEKLSAWEQGRIRRVVTYLATHGPASSFGAPFDDGDVGVARQYRYVEYVPGMLTYRLTQKGHNLFASGFEAGLLAGR